LMMSTPTPRRKKPATTAIIAISALMAGMTAAMVPSLVLFARYGSKARKMGIPFAPFLALGSVVALFAGGALLNAYWAFFTH